MQYFWLIIAAFVVSVIARRLKAPYALSLVVAGLVIGLTHLLPQVHLDPQVLMTVFLPPLLFETAINLRVSQLRQDARPIFVYSLFGTLASTFIIGGIAWRLLHMPLAVALVFGALISTTDPISVVAVFKRLGPPRRLRLLIEAESLFNNDIAVVLFTITAAIAYGTHVTPVGAVLQFIQLSAGGAVLGLLIGFAASRVHVEIDDHLVEITLTTIVAFGSYLCANALHVSGVMAVIVSGIVIGNYGMERAMTASTRLAVNSFWEYAGFVVNSLVFLLIGIEVVHVPWLRELPFLFGAVLAVLVGRAAIYPLSAFLNAAGEKISMRWQHIMVWGGLRGALSMALVLGLEPNFPGRESLVAATFGVVLFSLLVQGLSLGRLLQRLGMGAGAPTRPGADENSEVRRLAAVGLATSAAIVELERLRDEEIYPNWTIEILLRQYRQKHTDITRSINAKRPDYESRDERLSSTARQRSLLAEKASYQEAEKQGWLDEEDWLSISRRINTELDALMSESAQ